MKFICVDCDEQLLVQKVDAKERGSVWIHLRCRLCGWQMTLVAEAGETELIRKMGIRFGQRGRTTYMELVKGSRVEDEPAPAGSTDTDDPFAEPRGPELVLRWTTAAEEIVASIPDSLRPMIVAGIERFARSEGYRRVDETVLEDMKNRFRP